jgi:hypothetical protein
MQSPGTRSSAARDLTTACSGKHDQVSTATITLLDAGNSGAAYLHLNGRREVVAGLIMTERELGKD